MHCTVQWMSMSYSALLVLCAGSPLGTGAPPPPRESVGWCLDVFLIIVYTSCWQATGLDAWASRVKCPARFVSHLHDICIYIWVVHSFCLFCCLFIIVTTQFVALYEPCKPKPKPKPKPSTYDTRTTTSWQRSKFRYLDRSQNNKYAINMQIQTVSVSK